MTRLLAGTLLGTSGIAAADFSLPDPLPPHPRLLASPADWERVKEQIRIDSISSRLFAVLEEKAKHFLTQPPAERVLVGGYLLATARMVEERVVTLALVARVTGDKAFADRAIQEMLAASRFPDWGPGSYLAVAEMSLGLAIGYDWLFDELSEAGRQEIAEALREKGLRPSLPETTWWLGHHSNWNQVCHAGMSAAAIAIADLEPELAARILQRAIGDVTQSVTFYAPDGVYPEGPMYWDYGTTFHVVLAAALQTFSGSAFGLDTLPGMDKTALYIAEMTAPGGLYFNYSDARAEHGMEIPVFWLARQFRRPEWLRNTLQRSVGVPPASEMRPSPPTAPDHLAAAHRAPSTRDRLLALALLWRDPTLEKDPEHALPLHWLGRGINPVAVFRSAFDDPAAVFVGIKGGSPSNQHAHMDAGSFVLESDGVRWAVDPGMQEYASLESQGITRLFDLKQNGQRWTVFRLGPESHNILRFNDAPQDVSGNGQFVRFQGEGASPHGVLDLTSLSAGQVRSFHRGVKFLQNKAVLFQDEWTAADEPVGTAWQLLTRAEVTMQPGKIRLEENGKTLTLDILDPPGAEVDVRNVQELQKPFDADNPGLRRITIKTRTGSGAAGKFRILAVPGSSAPVDPPGFQELLQWSPPLEPGS